MKKILGLAFAVFLLGCRNGGEDVKTSVVPVKETSHFQMYEMSEMASLMEQMFAYNTQLKERILNAEPLGVYPVAFDKLHTAVLTETSDRDAFFNDQALQFIAAQKMIYSDSANAEIRFNEMVGQCLECHSKKCGGPIPRIKKLLIP